MSSQAPEEHENVLSRAENASLISKILDAAQEVRTCLAEQDEIQVPKIVAVGNQSSGKSSVMSALSGIPLPHGEGMTTKLPLVLSLRKLEDGPAYAEVCVVHHGRANGPGERVQLSEVSNRIHRLTRQHAEQDGEVNFTVMSQAEIQVKVFSKASVEMDIIDLPGLIKVERGQAGGQHIDNLVKRYVKEESTIILHVHDIANDLQTSNALSLTAPVDPKRKRSLLCYTKIDLFTSDGKNMKRCGLKLRANNNDWEHRPGVAFCVRNYSEVDEDENRTLGDIAKSEAEFFQIDGVRAVMKEYNIGMGRTPLANHLSGMQYRMLKDKLPGIQGSIQRRLQEVLSDLKNIKPPDTAGECNDAFAKKLADLRIKLREKKFNANDTRTRVAVFAAACAGPFREQSEAIAPLRYFETWKFHARMCRATADGQEIHMLAGGIPPGPFVDELRALQEQLRPCAENFLALCSSTFREKYLGIFNQMMEEYPRLRDVMRPLLDDVFDKIDTLLADQVDMQLEAMKDPFLLSRESVAMCVNPEGRDVEMEGVKRNLDDIGQSIFHQTELLYRNWQHTRSHFTQQISMLARHFWTTEAIAERVYEALRSDLWVAKGISKQTLENQGDLLVKLMVPETEVLLRIDDLSKEKKRLTQALAALTKVVSSLAERQPTPSSKSNLRRRNEAFADIIGQSKRSRIESAKPEQPLVG